MPSGLGSALEFNQVTSTANIHNPSPDAAPRGLSIDAANDESIDVAAIAQAREKLQRRRRRLWRRGIALTLLGVWLGVAYYHHSKALPAGLSVASDWVTIPEHDLKLLIDTTTADSYGQPLIQQQIFDEKLRVIRAARRFIVADYFLFNPHRGALANSTPPLRELSRELRDALLEARRANPQLQVLFITDPINDVYQGAPSADLAQLRAAGVEVVNTDLDRLRDSNALYSSAWRLLIKWWTNNSTAEGSLPNPLDDGPDTVGFAAWAKLLNFKANHRKLLIADDGADDLVGIVGSMNPHDGSSSHSNMALALRGPALLPLLRSELEIARLSGWHGRFDHALPSVTAQPGATQARLLTESAIAAALTERLRAARNGDQVLMAMFYLSDREIVTELLAAAARGVKVRLILDPNQDAFGRQKSGIPNRPVAAELTSASDGGIELRWYRTRGEQFHTKMVLVRSGTRSWLTLGSANLTRRNIRDFNLEANLAVEMPATAELGLQLERWFDELWFNRGPTGSEYTTDLGTYADPSQSSYWAYRIMEATGLSTF